MKTANKEIRDKTKLYFKQQKTLKLHKTTPKGRGLYLKKENTIRRPKRHQIKPKQYKIPFCKNLNKLAKISEFGISFDKKSPKFEKCYPINLEETIQHPSSISNGKSNKTKLTKIWLTIKENVIKNNGYQSSIHKISNFDFYLKKRITKNSFQLSFLR